jgi:hypothetical protein
VVDVALPGIGADHQRRDPQTIVDVRLERLGQIPTAPRDPANGYRLYDDAAIERIRQALDEMRPSDARMIA